MWQEIVVYIIFGIVGCYLVYRLFFRTKNSLTETHDTACADCPADCALRDLNVLREDVERGTCGRVVDGD